MENKNLTVGPTGGGRVQPVGPTAPGGRRPRTAANSDHGPFDLDAAAARLERLLAEDAEAGRIARADVPQRGFYLSVYV